MKRLLWIALVASALLSCTENEMAKNFGGTMKIKVPCDEKVFDITWKDDDFWYATKPMLETDIAEVITYRADSSYGIYEGEVILTESKCQ